MGLYRFPKDDTWVARALNAVALLLLWAIKGPNIARMSPRSIYFFFTCIPMDIDPFHFIVSSDWYYCCTRDRNGRWRCRDWFCDQDIDKGVTLVPQPVNLLVCSIHFYYPLLQQSNVEKSNGNPRKIMGKTWDSQQFLAEENFLLLDFKTNINFLSVLEIFF